MDVPQFASRSSFGVPSATIRRFGRRSDGLARVSHAQKMLMSFVIMRELLPATPLNQNNVRLIVNQNRKEVRLF